jgi:hypothetical protein
MAEDQYFSSIQYDIFGPMFLDIHLGGDFVNETRAGIGIGFRF